MLSDSGYTPSTREIRIAFVYGDESTPEIYEARVEAFDRWLSSHDAAIRADERKLLADEFAKHSMNTREETMPVNAGYVTTEAWLRGQSFTGTEGEQK